MEQHLKNVVAQRGSELKNWNINNAAALGYDHDQYEKIKVEKQAALTSAEKDLMNFQEQVRQLQREGGEAGKKAATEAESKAKAADQRADTNLATIKNLQSQVAEINARLSGSGPLAEAESNRQRTITTNETVAEEKRAVADISNYKTARQNGNIVEALAVLKDLKFALDGHAEVTRYVAGLGVTVHKIEAAQAELRRELNTVSSRSHSYLTP